MALPPKVLCAQERWTFPLPSHDWFLSAILSLGLSLLSALRGELGLLSAGWLLQPGPELLRGPQ